mmetsp:Transcript_31418/g.89662  ORF Transcript_31418/g.89662 Transcript_31418/m.89662 type:complete len:218 (-) Transcript_31418:1716-2369(-)
MMLRSRRLSVQGERHGQVSARCPRGCPKTFGWCSSAGTAARARRPRCGPSCGSASETRCGQGPWSRCGSGRPRPGASTGLSSPPSGRSRPSRARRTTAAAPAAFLASAWRRRRRRSWAACRRGRWSSRCSQSSGRRPGASSGRCSAPSRPPPRAWTASGQPASRRCPRGSGPTRCCPRASATVPTWPCSWRAAGEQSRGGRRYPWAWTSSPASWTAR